MTCKRCGEHTPRLTLRQRHCPQCSREVGNIKRWADRPRRFPFMDRTGWLRWPGVLV